MRLGRSVRRGGYVRILIAVAAIWAGWIAVAPALVAAEPAGGLRLALAATYLTGRAICHQQPARSFASSGVPWPVCARCAGLYLAAPVGAALALWVPSGVRRRFPARPAGRIGLVALAASPMIVSLGVEWIDAARVTNLVRAASAVPFGLLVAWLAGAGVLDDLR